MLEAGLVRAGSLDGLKARVLLALLLAEGADQARIAEVPRRLAAGRTSGGGVIKGDIVVRGGTVVTDSWCGPATVMVSGGRITGVLDPAAEVEAPSTVDATGMLVLPGGVDPHCHVGVPLGDRTRMDSFASASLGALAGGTTTIVDFAIPAPARSRWRRSRRLAKAKTPGATTPSTAASIPRPDHRRHRPRYVEAGVRTVKLFTTYRGLLMVELTRCGR